MARHRSDDVKRVAAAGCRLPARLPNGEILTDIRLNKWRLGDSIGWGGFGDIYLASDNISESVDDNAKYIVKIEPHDNGPLFVEMNFYIRASQQEMISMWRKKHCIRHLGVPTYEGSGSHIFQGQRYRFLVIPRYEIDIGKLFLSKNRKFSEKFVKNLAVQMLYALEYIHSKGYAHSDIKGSNILLNEDLEGDSDKIQAFLVDYGLAFRFQLPSGKHKPFVHDERRAHEGTLEYNSRDAHHGTHSMRGDLETLGYNLIHWMGGKLPWEQKEGGVSSNADPELIQEQKEECLSNVSLFLHKCFQNKKVPSTVAQYMDYVKTLEFESKPNYTYLRSIFGYIVHIDKSIADFYGRKVSNENLCLVRKPRRENLRTRNPCKPVNGEVRMTRNTYFIDNEPFKWEKILATHPEKLAKMIVQPLDSPPHSKLNSPIKPTYAMFYVMYKIKERDSGSRNRSCKLLNDVQAKWINPPLETPSQLKKKFEKHNHSNYSDEEINSDRKSKKRKVSCNNNNNVAARPASKRRRRSDD